MPEAGQEVIKARRFLKDRLQRDYTTLRGYEAERSNVRQLLQRTAEMGESNSLLLIGPRGAGKTTLINSVLTDLLENMAFVDNTLIVHLDGNLHTDDRIALKSITVQMRLENAADGKVFGSFAENLAFLLQCLKAGDKKSKSVVFVLEEFDLFCAHHNQTLLYNLFDVSQSAQAPICVLGVTCRLDVIELLEKRVKSRFSHRQVFLFPSAHQFEEYAALFQELISIPSSKELKSNVDRIDSLELLKSEAFTFQRNHFDSVEYTFDKRFVDNWNKEISKLMKSPTVEKTLKMLYDFDVSQAFLKMFIFRLVAKIKREAPHITAELVAALATQYECDDKVDLLCGLSVLELCLIIAIKHHSTIYDRDPFNFEIVFGRFNKFAKVSSTMQGVERAIVLKAFEHLRIVELIMPLSNSGLGKVQKEFEMHKLALTYGQIQQAVQRYQALPTEVAQWAQSSLI
ncbi:origin recognition complex subunit 4 [Drosophila sulfurigaster albostrigata]|uniref:origin recognition complex subunit 4 n=1 Tax=Drosophila sulfurigaster albostrigata TaxID=89887 RepID=UPI002D21AE58|nr:origin recognition complex subunit 4 [Drosophila sulfurigaster albostrigata]